MLRGLATVSTLMSELTKMSDYTVEIVHVIVNKFLLLSSSASGKVFTEMPYSHLVKVGKTS
jgi:hypothetical protein